MPTLLRTEGYRFFIYTDQLKSSPIIQATRAGCVMKIALDPIQELKSFGCDVGERRRIMLLVQRHRLELLEAWHEVVKSRPGRTGECSKVR